ncbi:MAG TPA: MBL fold metallo-hydrolase [Aestuariivirgaceae bacterium]|nr:MBL fold metallo-hydrolase [Aestuariivirgaceae bacterium]
MSLKLTILGCGSSGGVPRIGNHWGSCNPANPKNNRKRCSLMVEQSHSNGTTRVLIDTSPDLRDQLLAAGVGVLDGVVFTHPHADHTHGIDELRAVALNMRRRVPVWADSRTSDALFSRFAYAFRTPEGSVYPPILDIALLRPPAPVEIAGEGGKLTLVPFEVDHGDIRALGFRVGNVAYTPDINGVPAESQIALSGLSCWIVDALRRTPHPSHWSLPETLEWISRYKPKTAVITNMHLDLDYDALCKELPPHVTPAYDGMLLSFD